MMLLIVFEIIKQKGSNASELLLYIHFSVLVFVLCGARNLGMADSSNGNNTIS
jgi:hypothetical protein